MSTEFIRCKTSIRAIESALLLFFIGVMLAIIALYDANDKCIKTSTGSGLVCSTDPTTDANYQKLIGDKLLAGGILTLIALIIAIIATLNALRFACYKTALAGSFLSLLILL